jgi:hypothetical protein
MAASILPLLKFAVAENSAQTVSWQAASRKRPSHR